MVSVLLCDVRSHYNVGAIFRTADAVGVERLYVGGITPAPIDRFGRVVPEIQKTALGATASVAWESVPDILAKIAILKASGTQIVAVEQTDQSIPITQYKPLRNTCYVFGSEVAGVPDAVVRLADSVVELPMHGIKESLNVSVTVGVVLFYHEWHVS